MSPSQLAIDRRRRACNSTSSTAIRRSGRRSRLRPNDGAAIPIRATVEVVAPGGLLAGTATVDAADVFVFPVGPTAIHCDPEDRTARPAGHSPHPAHRAGRRVRRHPPLRARRPAAHGQLAGERAPRQPARDTAADRPRRRRGGADRHVSRNRRVRRRRPPNERCAAPFRWCRAHCEAVTGPESSHSAAVGPRWLGADIGRRQFYRVLDTVLGAGDEFETTTGTLAPRAALPPGAIVVAFSTMLDTEFALSLIDLRKRGHTVVAVDVLEGAPFVRDRDRTRCSPGCGRCSDRSCTATWAPSESTWCPGRRTSTLDQSMRLVPERRRPVRGRR